MSEEPQPELTTNQKFLLGMKSITLTLHNNIQFLHLLLKQNPKLIDGLNENIQSINVAISMMLAYKNGTLQEEYDFLVNNDNSFKFCHDTFLEKRVQIAPPKPKSSLLLPGDF